MNVLLLRLEAEMHFNLKYCLLAAILATPSAALSQTAPSYQADPSVYKILYEDQNFRVIEATRKAGVRDKPHAHPLAGVAYYVTDCPTKLYTDGKVVENNGRAGTAGPTPIVASHEAENIGSADCKQILVEKK